MASNVLEMQLEFLTRCWYYRDKMMNNDIYPDEVKEKIHDLSLKIEEMKRWCVGGEMMQIIKYHYAELIRMYKTYNFFEEKVENLKEEIHKEISKLIFLIEDGEEFDDEYYSREIELIWKQIKTLKNSGVDSASYLKVEKQFDELLKKRSLMSVGDKQ